MGNLNIFLIGTTIPSVCHNNIHHTIIPPSVADSVPYFMTKVSPSPVTCFQSDNVSCRILKTAAYCFRDDGNVFSLLKQSSHTLELRPTENGKSNPGYAANQSI